MDLLLYCFVAADNNNCFPANAFAMIQDPATGLPAPKRLSATVPGDRAQVLCLTAQLVSA